MKFIKKIILSFILSLSLAYISFKFSIVPCKKVYNLVGVPSNWETCSFSFSTTGQAIGENLYFGRYSDPFEAVLVFLAIAFVAIFLILTFLLRRKKGKS